MIDCRPLLGVVAMLLAASFKRYQGRTEPVTGQSYVKKLSIFIFVPVDIFPVRLARG